MSAGRPWMASIHPLSLGTLAHPKPLLAMPSCGSAPTQDAETETATAVRCDHDGGDAGGTGEK